MQRALQSDPDGDSQMRSSSSSDEADSENMFPAELDPPGSTTQNNFASGLSQPSRFTPPQSQDPGEPMDGDPPQGNEPVVDFMKLYGRQNKNTGNQEWVPQSDFAKSAAEIPHEPGAAWSNKKAREEYQRVMMVIEDKNWSLSMLNLEWVGGFKAKKSYRGVRRSI